jgi:pimeloyl-ACP methyl ester carboxylesterase
MKYGPQFIVPPEVKLCGVICADGLELMGLASTETVDGSTTLAVLYVPGQFDNAYQQRKNHYLLEAAVESSLGCVLANTRGQDYYGYQRRYPSPTNTEEYTWELLGSTFERVREANYDLAAWTTFISSYSPTAAIVLVGHSHGAVKVANYMLAGAGNATQRVQGVVLLSPSDDIGSQRDRLKDRYDKALELAAKMVDDGQPNDLMPKWAFSAPMSAGTYYEAYGPDSPLTTFAYHEPSLSPLSHDSSGWQQPTLVVFGSDDGATGVMGSDQACEVARGLLSQTERCDTFVVPNTNHHYRGAEDVVAQRVVQWIRETSGAAERQGSM